MVVAKHLGHGDISVESSNHHRRPTLAVTGVFLGTLVDDEILHGSNVTAPDSIMKSRGECSFYYFRADAVACGYSTSTFIRL